MADYRELLRRAISALPENNGAARRAVYEKARSALVGQLRSITPPLPARDITQHRLQLEDCIREVEQEASEANIKLGRNLDAVPQSYRPEPRAPEPEPEVEQEPAPPEPRPEPIAKPEPAPIVLRPAYKPEPRPPLVVPERETAKAAPPPVAPVKQVEPVAAANVPNQAAAFSNSIEDIIAAAENASSVAPAAKPIAVKDQPDALTRAANDRAMLKSAPVSVDGNLGSEAEQKPISVRPVPSIVARADAPKSAPFSLQGNKPASTPSVDGARTNALFGSRGDSVPNAANQSLGPVGIAPAIEPLVGGQAAAARQFAQEPEAQTRAFPVETALSSVREVEVESAAVSAKRTPAEAEGAIERAIATLDAEARGEPAPLIPERPESEKPSLFSRAKPAADAPRRPDATSDAAFAQVSTDDRDGSGGLRIFLIVFAVLLIAVGGAGYWAYREGYISLDQMFGRTIVADANTANPTTTVPTPSTGPSDATPGDQISSPGNTSATTANPEPTTELQTVAPEERLTPTDTPTATLPSVPGVAEPSDGEVKGEERLPVETAPTTAELQNAPAASVDPSILAGTQSLLLEASDDGRTGAVPFSGTVEWSEGTDDLGLPTLVAKANIPARNLTVDVTIRKNSDPSLPASHLMEVDFVVSETFIGGSVAGLPGVLLKNEELVQGTPLVGASARVVGNSFLFALSASAEDNATNNQLLTTRKWMDLAVIYATGKRAIITLEKDPEAEALFTKVFAGWANPAAASAN